jgi:hypothetical protein
VHGGGKSIYGLGKQAVPPPPLGLEVLAAGRARLKKLRTQPIGEMMVKDLRIQNQRVT